MGFHIYIKNQASIVIIIVITSNTNFMTQTIKTSTKSNKNSCINSITTKRVTKTYESREEIHCEAPL